MATKFGPDLVPGFSHQLQSNVPLATMRAQMKLALDGTKSGFDATMVLSPNSKLKEITVGSMATNNQCCVNLRGGASYLITPNKICITTAIEANKDTIKIQTSKDGLGLALPDGLDLTLFASAPIASTLLALSLISSERVIYVGEWSPRDQCDKVTEGNDAYWPASWEMPNVAEGVAFPRIWLQG